MTYQLLFTVAVTEIRLTLRNLGYWLYVLSITALSLIILLIAPPNGWPDAMVDVANNALFFQFPLLAIVIAPALTRHHRLSREWVWATRLDYPLLLLGQILGLGSIIFISSLLPITVTSIWFLLKDPGFGMHVLALWRFGLTSLIPVTFLEISIVFAFACWLRNVALTIALSTALDLFLWLGILMPVASLLTPLNHTLLTLHLDPVAGLGAEHLLVSRLLAFYVCLGGGLIVSSIWGTAHIPAYGDAQPRNRPYLLGGVLIGLVGLSLTLWGYTAAVKQRTVPPPPSSDQIDVWTVVTSSHSGSIAGAEINLKSELVVCNVSDEPQEVLTLSLNPGQECVEATIDDRPVSCKRTGEFVEVSPPTPVPPDGLLDVEIVYSGSPILLREEYALVNAVRGNNPSSYQNPVRTYLDDNVIYLHRDGNWLVWPLSTPPHISSHDTLTVEVSRDVPLISSGSIADETAEHITYHWSGMIPQLLLVSAPYQVTERSGTTIFWGPYSGRTRLAKAQAAGEILERLARKVESEPGERYRVVMLPYAQEMVVSGSLIGLQASRAQDFTDDTASFYSLARDVSRAWLIDRIGWPREVSTAGYFRSAHTICDPPDETGYQECKTVSLGSENPQAPQGRLVEKESRDPLLSALSTVLALRLTEDVTGDEAFVQGTHEQWVLNAECTGTTMMAPEKYQNARWALVIQQLFDEIGPEGVAQLLQTLTTAYAPGTSPLTTREFLQSMDTHGYVMEEFEADPACPIPTGGSE